MILISPPERRADKILIRGRPMQQILYSGQIKEADEAAVSRLGIPSPVLMERAALLTADAVCECFPDKGSVLVAAGSGNNGGDGFAAARLLRQRGWRASFLRAMPTG